MIPRSAVTSLESREGEPRTVAFHSEGPHEIEPPVAVSLESLRGVFDRLRRAGCPVVIGYSSDSDDEEDGDLTSFGVVRGVADTCVLNRWFGPNFDWRWDLDEIVYDDILRVSFGGSYLAFYERHLEPVADYERREREARATAEGTDP